jgi:hypothetical protein
MKSQTVAMKIYGVQVICLLFLMVATVASVNLGLRNLSEAAVGFIFVRYSTSHRKESKGCMTLDRSLFYFQLEGVPGLCKLVIGLLYTVHQRKDIYIEHLAWLAGGK